MDLRKKLLVAGSVGVLGLGAFGLTGAARAETTGQTSLVDKLASTFHLDKTEVQKVFDQQRSEDQSSRAAQAKDRLAQAVKDGKLTQVQMDAIIAKQAELKTARAAHKDALKGKTRAERKTAMEAERTALKQWASDHGIPEQYLFGLGGPGGHGRGGRSGADTAPR